MELKMSGKKKVPKTQIQRDFMVVLNQPGLIKQFVCY